MIVPCLFEGEEDILKSTPLYRYLSVEAFLYLIGVGSLRFSRITKNWPDFYEGSRYDFLKKAIKEHHQFANKEKDDFYANCWSLQSAKESLYENNEEYKLAIEELEKEGSAPM